MKKIFLPKLLLPILVASSTIIGANSTKVSAAPINDEKLELTQPDGQVIQCYASGDEFYNYYHDSDGRAILKDKKTGYYVYGKYVKDKVQPSRERVTEANIEDLKQIDSDSRVNMKDVKVPEDEIQKQRELLNANNPVQRTKNIGKFNNIVIFIKFSDQDEFKPDLSKYNTFFNSKDQVSLNNYYKEISYNKLDINSTFYPKPNGNTILSYTDSHPRSYYTDFDQNDEDEKKARLLTLLKNAVESVENEIPSDLNVDSDDDGYVDNVCFIIKGKKEAWSNLLWPQQSNMYYPDRNHLGSYYRDVKINDKIVGTYNFQLEESMNVGVLSHEMFHTLGAPDLYHYHNKYDIKKECSNPPIGKWDLMGDAAIIPKSTGAYMKKTYGKWIDDIKEINKSGKYSINKIGIEDNNSYIIKSPNSDKEYFIVEYRKKEGKYDSTLPEQGLLIYKINTAFAGKGNRDGVDGSGNDEIYLYRSHGGLNDSGFLVFASLGGNIRSSMSSKELFLSNGSDSGISLENISILGDTATFDVVINGQIGNCETVDENLPLKYNVNFDDTKTLSKAEDISGECVYGKKINDIELYLKGVKYMDAERGRLNDPENKYKGYDLSNAAFKFSVDFSKFSDGDHPYEIRVTTEDGQKISIKQGYLKVKKQTDGTEDKNINEWKPGTIYKVGDIVTYNNYKYKCLVVHNSIVTWEPSNTPTLWGRIN